jgi:hypothetical protein
MIEEDRAASIADALRIVSTRTSRWKKEGGWGEEWFPWFGANHMPKRGRRFAQNFTDRLACLERGVFILNRS